MLHIRLSLSLNSFALPRQRLLTTTALLPNYRGQIRTALHQSVGAAYLLFGFLSENHGQSCLSAEK